MPDATEPLSLALDASREAPSLARHAVGERIEDPDARADLELATSELVTSAIELAEQDAVEALVLVALEVEPDAYTLTVSSSPAPAEGAAARPAAELGVAILRALGCDVEVRHEGHRRIAVCRLPRPRPAGSHAALDVS